MQVGMSSSRRMMIGWDGIEEGVERIGPVIRSLGSFRANRRLRAWMVSGWGPRGSERLDG